MSFMSPRPQPMVMSMAQGVGTATSDKPNGNAPRAPTAPSTMNQPTSSRPRRTSQRTTFLGSDTSANRRDRSGAGGGGVPVFGENTLLGGV
jgi:hypothetical protein